MAMTEQERMSLAKAVLSLAKAAHAAGVPVGAWEDVLNRASTRLTEPSFDGIAARDFVHTELRQTAGHLWRGETTTETPPAAQARKQEPVDWSKLPPAERLTRFREQEHAKAQQQR